MKIEIKKGPTTEEALYKAYTERAEDWRRMHLGASIIGHKCDRYLWLAFRWAANPNHDGKQLRLFERGDREESWVIRDLRRAGFTVVSRDENGKQIRFRDGHVGGGRDGTITGIPEAPATEHILEIKSSNKKQFERLQEKGVKSSKLEHYVQMQLYMLKGKLDRALYVVVCKDNDEIYTERVKLDRAFAQEQLDRAQAIVKADIPPPKMSNEFPPCKYTSKDGTEWPCDFYDLCHGKQMPERNCRTCCDSTAVVNVEGVPAWACSKPGRENYNLSPARQRKGCSEQLSIPAIVNGSIAKIDSETNPREITYQFVDGTIAVEGPR